MRRDSAFSAEQPATEPEETLQEEKTRPAEAPEEKSDSEAQTEKESPDGSPEETVPDAVPSEEEPAEEEKTERPSAGSGTAEEGQESGGADGNPEEGFSSEEEPAAREAVSAEDGELYALVLEGFQVTDELMTVQIGLLVLLLAMFVFRFVYHLISDMVTKYQ